MTQQALNIQQVASEVAFLKETSIPVVDIKNSNTLGTKTTTFVEKTHFVALKASDLDNGNLVRTNDPKNKGIKTFTNNMLDYNFKLHGLRLFVETDSTANGWNAATADFMGDLPAVIANAEIEITQNGVILSLTGREAFANHKNQLDKSKRTFVLTTPVQILANEPFGITFKNLAGLTTQAFRVELDGIEMAVVSANSKMC